MSVVAASVSLAVGVMYLVLGIASFVDDRREPSAFARSFFAAAMTCGGHHLVHAEHQFAGRTGHWFETATVLVGLVPAIVFVGLRASAARGGPSDVHLDDDNPLVVPTIVASIALAGSVLAVAAMIVAERSPSASSVPSFVLAALYLVVGATMLGAQRRRAAEAGYWSLAGTSLAAVFATCAFAHLAYGVAPVETDVHMVLLDSAGVLTSLWFTIEVCGLAARAHPGGSQGPIHRPERSPAPWSAAG